MAAPINAATRFVSRGSFGCVVEPALPNENETGTWTQFPRNVSKLFRNRENYNAALQHTRKAQNLMGHNRGHRMNTYRHNYKTANSLPHHIRKSCSLEKGEPIWVARMPHLGVSLWEIDYIPNRTKLRRIPVAIIVQQVWKLLTQVHAIYKAAHIHGDIRETNIMIDPETGVMTLIDFDWLLPANQYLAEYPLGYYSNPPECIMASEMRSEIDAETDVRESMDRMFMNVLGTPDRRDRLNRYMRQYSRLMISHVFDITSVFHLKAYLLDNMLYYQEKNKDLLAEKPNAGVADREMYTYFDSYGLGFSLFDFLSVVYPGGTEKDMMEMLPSRISKQGVPYTDLEIRTIATVLVHLKTLCLRMGHIQTRKRIGIEDAMKEFQDIPDIYEMGPFAGCDNGKCAIMGGKRHQRQSRQRQTRRHTRKR